MSTFVLVHGGWQAAWCWEKVVPLLEESGHEVFAPDLPGHGSEDRTPVAEVSLERYVGRVCEVLDGLSEPVVLVGHSLGGPIISEVAERRPEQVGLLVYLTAFLLPDGESLLGIAQTDEEAIILQHADVDEEKGVITIRAGGAKEVFYADCSEEDARRAIGRLIPQPLAPDVTPVNVSGANFGRVRRAYIETLQDRALGPALQRRMYTALPCEKVISMETSHSPFISRPEELAGHLDSLAKL